MCYSAAVRADHAAFQRLFPSSRMAIKEFFELYWRKKAAKPVPRTPRVMDAQFTHAKGQDEQAVRELIQAPGQTLDEWTESLCHELARLASC